MYEAALALSVVCFVLVTGYFVRSASFSLFHPLTFYAVFHGFIFVFRPIVVWLNDYSYVYRGYQFTPSPSDKLTVILASNAGFLAFAFFCLLSGNVAMRFKQDDFSHAERDRLKPLLLGVLAICVPISLYSLGTLWLGAASGSAYATMTMDAGTGVIINTQTNGYLTEAQLMLASCGALVAWVYRFRLLSILPLLAFAVFRAGTGGRGPFVAALVTVGLLYLYEHRRRIPSLRVMGLLIAVVIAFSSVGTDRGAAIRQAIGTDDTSIFKADISNQRWLEGMDFANLEYFEYLVYAIPQRTQTYSYFLDSLQVFTEPVPRVLWAGKPVGAPFNKIFLFNYGRPIGMTRSLPGEGWFAWGWFGVFIWCSLWGYVLGLIYRKFVEGTQSAFKTAAYMIFVPILIVGYRDGTLVTIFRQGLFYLAPVGLWYLISRYFGVPSAAAMRAAAVRRLRRSAAGDAGGETSPAPSSSPAPPSERPDAALAVLPAAVQRRRAALASGGAQKP